MSKWSNKKDWATDYECWDQDQDDYTASFDDYIPSIILGIFIGTSIGLIAIGILWIL